MKPSWDDAPSYARWLCQDQDGRWVWFQCKPVVGKDGRDWRQGRRVGSWDYADVVSPNWRNTLERRP